MKKLRALWALYLELLDAAEREGVGVSTLTTPLKGLLDEGRKGKAQRERDRRCQLFHSAPS